MTVSTAKSVEAIEAEAASWAARLDAAPGALHPGLDDWIGQDPRHAGALLRAQSILALFAPGEAVEEPETAGGARSRWKDPSLWGGAVAALAATVAAVFLLFSPAERYETQLGEVRSLALSDGSSVSIDANSRIEVAFDGDTRDVHLDSGRVLFRAEHDADRPFRVIVDDIVITDIGTAFQVTDDDRSGEVEVLVTEGAVRVDAPSGAVELRAGQKAQFAKSAAGGSKVAPQKMASADIDRALAWREGWLELNGETLDSALVEFNRHSALQLRVTDPALGQEQLYGSFRMNDAEGFARAIAVSLGTESRAGPDGIAIGPQKKTQGR